MPQTTAYVMYASLRLSRILPVSYRKISSDGCSPVLAVFKTPRVF